MSMRPPSFAQPLSLRQLTRIESEALTLLATRVRAFPWPGAEPSETAEAESDESCGSPGWHVTLEPLPADAPSSFASDDWHIRMQWSGAAFDLSVPSTAANAWIAGSFPDLDVPALPAAYRAAVLESVIDEVSEALGVERSPTIDNIVHAQGSATDAPGRHRFSLVLENEGARVRAILAMGTEGLIALAGLVSGWPAAAGPVDAEGVPVPLRAEIGMSSIALGELQSLKPGDAVVIQRYWVGNDRQLVLRHGDHALRVRAEETRLVVTRRFQIEEEDDMTMEEADDPAALPPAAAAGELTPLESMPVRIHFDIGSRTLSLAEVGALQVGQVIELNRPLSRAVDIRANGALIGTGELMEIGGRIAVSITALGRMQETRDADQRT